VSLKKRRADFQEKKRVFEKAQPSEREPKEN
jgi:hypothetical protein